MMTIYLILAVLSLLYFWFKFVYSYWERKGFPYIKPSIPFGNLSNSVLGNKSIGEELFDLYRTSTKPIEGIFYLYRPALLVRDAGLAKQMLTKDFGSFHDRGFYYNPKKDPVGAHMLMAPGREWKSIRSKLTPTFTSGKLKGMMPIIVQIADKLKNKLAPIAEANEVTNIKDLLVRMGMDIIGNVGFGLDVNTLNNPNDPFHDVQNYIRNGKLVTRLRFIGRFFCPKIFDILRIPSSSPQFQQYMIDLVSDTMKYRRNNQIVRNDFMQLLLELQETGTIRDGESFGGVNLKKNAPDSMYHLSIEECAAQVVLFYSAAFETTSVAICLTLFELSRKPELQKRLQDEIDNVMAKYNNIITYECFDEMPFLEACVKESLRKYPALPFLNRICTKEYQIDDLSLTIPKGTPIVFPLFGLMRNPEYFPNPDGYCPDRFLDEIPTYNPDAFLPFGDGPRNCIGLRMGKLVTKIALISLLKCYNFEYMDKQELEFGINSFTIDIRGGINMKVSNRHI